MAASDPLRIVEPMGRKGDNGADDNVVDFEKRRESGGSRRRKTTAEVDAELDKQRKFVDGEGEKDYTVLRAQAAQVIAESGIAVRKLELWDEAADSLKRANRITAWKTSPQP